MSLATLSAIAEASPDHNVECVPDLLTLAKLLFLSAGITKHQTHPDGERYFRAAACTGALYHIDLYLVCGELPDLSAGVYHFGPHDFALRCLRPGDYRHLLIQANGDEPAVARAPALLVCTSTYWRNAWKCQARTYRHWFWDAGTLLANTLAAGAALKLPIRVVAGFADAAVNHLLDLDPIIERFGNRAYRAAQLEAAIIGGKVYLAAYGQRLGATGLTFFDDDVKQFLAPHAAGKSVLFLTAVGKPIKRRGEV